MTDTPRLSEERWASIASRHQPATPGDTCLTCGEPWPCDAATAIREVVALTTERDALRAKLAEREPISHAEFSRFVQEAREQQERADALEAERDRLVHDLRQERQRRESIERRHENLIESQKHYGESRADMERRLDALLWVWCSGGCEDGILRWVDLSQYDNRRVAISEEVIDHAVRNMKRLVTKFRNLYFRPFYDSYLAAGHPWRKAVEMASAELDRLYPATSANPEQAEVARLTAENGRLQERLDWQKHKRGQVEADRDALLAENDRLREALQRLVDVDMGLRDQISKYLPDGPGMFLAVRGILIVQDAHDLLAAAQPPAAGTEGMGMGEETGE